MSAVTKKFVARKPKGFREGFSGELACPHRDVSTCDECVNTYANIVDGSGCHYWMRNEAEVAEFNEMIADVANMDADAFEAKWLA